MGGVDAQRRLSRPGLNTRPGEDRGQARTTLASRSLKTTTNEADDLDDDHGKKIPAIREEMR